MKGIRTYRKNAGLSVAKLAEMVGISRTQIYNLEKGLCNKANDETIKKISEVLNVSEIDLYGIDILRYIPKNQEECDKIISILEKEKEKWV